MKRAFAATEKLMKYLVAACVIISWVYFFLLEIIYERKLTTPAQPVISVCTVVLSDNTGYYICAIIFDDGNGK